MQSNHEPITAERVRAGKDMFLFFPNTAEEAAKIQDRLFAVGARWFITNEQEIGYLEGCVASGMVVDQDGMICVGPTESSLREGYHCILSDLPPVSGGLDERITSLVTEVTELRAAFNALAAQLQVEVPVKPAPKWEHPNTYDI